MVETGRREAQGQDRVSMSADEISIGANRPGEFGRPCSHIGGRPGHKRRKMNRTIISFQITQEEKELIERVCYLEPWLEDAIDNRRRKENKYQFKLIDDDFDDCLSALEYQAKLEPTDEMKFKTLVKRIIQVKQLRSMMNNKKRIRSI